MLLVQILLGFAFATLDYSILSYIVLVVEKDEKHFYLGNFYAITTIPSIFAPAIAGFLFSFFSNYFVEKICYFLVFIITFLLRVFCVYLFSRLPKTSEKDDIFYVLYRLKEYILRGS